MPKETIMVFCAHPDDEVIGVGGTIAKYARQGKQVIAVIFSYGESSHPWMQKKFTIKMRVKESRKAGKFLGCKKTVFLGLKDGLLSSETQTLKVKNMLENIILKYNPTKIFTHSYNDILYKDHRAVYDVVTKVIDKMRYEGEVYTFNVWNITNIRRRNLPRLIVDITNTFKLKMKALELFKSQKVALAQLMPIVYTRAFKHGFEAKCRWGEKFYKIR